MKRTLYWGLAISGIALLSLQFLAKPHANEDEPPAETPNAPTASGRAHASTPSVARLEARANPSATTASSAPQMATPREDPDAVSTREDRLSEMGILKRTLGLSDEQAKKLRPVLSREEARLSQVRRNPNLSRPDRVAKTREIQDSTDSVVAGLLTREQFEQWRRHRLPPQNPLADPPPGSESPRQPAANQPDRAGKAEHH